MGVNFYCYILLMTHVYSEKEKLDKLINDLFTQTYLKFTDTFNYIKIVWVHLNEDVVNDSNDSLVRSQSQRLKSVRYIKSFEFDRYNRVYYKQRKAHLFDNEIETFKVLFSQEECTKIVDILVLINTIYPNYSWPDVKNYLKPFWLEARPLVKKFINLLPLKIRYINYTEKNTKRIPRSVEFKTISDLKQHIVKNIDWENVEDIEFELYNNDFILNAHFTDLQKMTKFDTILHKTFTVFVNPDYIKNKSITHNSRKKSHQNFKEILQINTTYSYENNSLNFYDVEIEYTNPTVRITNDSLNIIEMYSNLIKNIYKISPLIIHEKFVKQFPK
jgi:hypothetical protein